MSQSPGLRHDHPLEHFAVHSPPQSIPVSVPSVILLKHDGPLQILFMQESTPLQSTFPVHDEFMAHPAHIPPQSIPVSPSVVSVILFLHDMGSDFESMSIVLEVATELLSPVLSITETVSVYEFPSTSFRSVLLFVVANTMVSFPLIFVTGIEHPFVTNDCGEQSMITLSLLSTSL